MTRFTPWIGFNRFYLKIQGSNPMLKLELANSIVKPVEPIPVVAHLQQSMTRLQGFWARGLRSFSPLILQLKGSLLPTSQAHFFRPTKITLLFTLGFPSIFKGAASFFILFCLSGCSPGFHYLFQATRGQLALTSHARPITEVVKDERVPTRIRKLLKEVEPIKQFGEVHGLKPTLNYTEFVQLDRKAVVWVVSACETLQFRAKEWSFPVVGSFPYLGWFNPQDAKNFSEELKQEGLDVDVRGASAYSTLGWFRDAILSTMIPQGPEALGDLVNVVLHESVHATIHIQNQSYFNESLASFVADRMTHEYLDRAVGPESPEKLSYVALEEKSKKNERKFHEAYQKLDALYRSPKPDEEKRVEKEKLLESLKKEVDYKHSLNNATLIQYKTYHSDPVAFEQLLARKGSDWAQFMDSLRVLKPDSFAKPQEEQFEAVLGSL